MADRALLGRENAHLRKYGTFPMASGVQTQSTGGSPQRPHDGRKRPTKHLTHYSHGPPLRKPDETACRSFLAHFGQNQL